MTIHVERYREGRRQFVRLPAHEFDKIMEDLQDYGDAHYAAEVYKQIKAGKMETYPIAFVQSLVGQPPGKAIALWRKYRGMSRDALAEAVGVTGGSITMIETGKRRGTIDVIRRIADALHCDIEYFA